MMQSKIRFQQVAVVAMAAAVLSTTGCYKDPLMQALPAGDENALLTPGGGYMNRLPTGTVSGRIIDERTKMGVPDVVVEVQNVNPAVSVRTDSSGNFVLNNVPQGQQIIVVNKLGYVYLATQGSIIATVMPNATISLPQIVLTPSVMAASNAYITSIGGMVEPYGVAVDNNRGFVYAVDRIGLNNLLDKRSEVKKFNLNGGFVKRFGGSRLSVENGNKDGGFLDLFTYLNWSYGIDVDAGGNVYVAETNKDRVVKFSADGDYVSKISDGIKNNYDVAVLNSGQIGVSSSGNSRVVLFDSNLVAASNDFAGTSSNAAVNGGFRGMATDNANFVYVIDSSAGPGRAIKKYEMGRSQPVLQFGTNGGSAPGQFKDATDLAVDNRNGDVYVVDRGNNRVERFDRDGRFVEQFGSAGRGNGQFDRPFGIALDKDGYIYVSDTGNKRIQKFAPGRLYNQPNSINNDINYPVK